MSSPSRNWRWRLSNQLSYHFSKNGQDLSFLEWQFRVRVILGWLSFRVIIVKRNHHLARGKDSQKIFAVRLSLLIELEYTFHGKTQPKSLNPAGHSYLSPEWHGIFCREWRRTDTSTRITFSWEGPSGTGKSCLLLLENVKKWERNFKNIKYFVFCFTPCMLFPW